jgi:hypothetical protein
MLFKINGLAVPKFPKFLKEYMLPSINPLIYNGLPTFQKNPHIPFFWNSKEIIMRENEYGTVSFTWHDITASKPKWEQDRCETFLAQYEDELYEVMLDAGWEFLKSNLIKKEKK